MSTSLHAITTSANCDRLLITYSVSCLKGGDTNQVTLAYDMRYRHIIRHRYLLRGGMERQTSMYCEPDSFEVKHGNVDLREGQVHRTHCVGLDGAMSSDFLVRTQLTQIAALY